MPVPQDSPLAEIGGTAFACVALAQASRASQAPVARRLIQQQPSAQVSDLDGVPFDVATFDALSPELPNLLCLVGDLKTAVVWVRGRHYPPGQHTRLYQWLSCYARMQAMKLPIGACDYMVSGYRLPCSLLGSFCAHEMSAHAEPSQFLDLAAAREGFDRCPRYFSERLIRIR